MYLKDIDLKGEDIKTIKGDLINGVDIVTNDGKVIHLDSNINGDFTMRTTGGA